MRTLSLCCALLAVLLSSAGPAHAATEYLIVTTDALSGAFAALADTRAADGYVTEVVTVEEIELAGVAGRDLPEQIRNYVREVHADGSLRFVVLGGDTALIPARFAFDDLFPAYGTEIPTDLYYAALDGDWDANGNDVFGEVLVDDTDLSPEVAVGRIPVATAVQAAQYVAKVGAYEDPAHVDHRDSFLLLGEVLFPADWNPEDLISLDGAEICEQVGSIAAASPRTPDAVRLYENSGAWAGASPLSVDAAVSILDAGQSGVVLHVGHGWEDALSMGDAVFSPADALGLTNGPRYFTFLSEVPNGAAFHHDAILEDFVRNPDGGAVCAIGWSSASFALTAAAFLEDITAEFYGPEPVTAGEALDTVRASSVGDARQNTVERWNLFAINLLGDPALIVGDPETATSGPTARAARLRLRSVVPNPFNPRLTVRFEVEAPAAAAVPVELTVYSAAGRIVRHLWSGQLLSGPYSRQWDGNDDAGVPLGSGMYFVAIESGTERVVAKATLLK